MSCFTWITCEEFLTALAGGAPCSPKGGHSPPVARSKAPAGERGCVGRAGGARPRCRFTGSAPSQRILAPPWPGRAAAGTPRLRLARVAAHRRCPGVAICHPRRSRAQLRLRPAGDTGGAPRPRSRREGERPRAGSLPQASASQGFCLPARGTPAPNSGRVLRSLPLCQRPRSPVMAII